MFFCVNCFVLLSPFYELAKIRYIYVIFRFCTFLFRHVFVFFRKEALSLYRSFRIVEVMGIVIDDLQSFRPYHPGELVKDELESRG